MPAATATLPDRKPVARQPKEQRVAAILAAARDEFELQGFEKAKVAEIAARVGVVEGTIFHYFRNKRELMVRVMEDFYKDITADQQNGIKGVKGTRNRLRYVIWHHLRVISDNASLCGVILRESRGLGSELTADVQRFNRKYTNCLNTVISGGIEAGEIRLSTSVSLVRNTVYGSIEHALWSLLSGEHEIDVDAYADELLQLVFQGISADESALEKNEVASLIRKLGRLV